MATNLGVKDGRPFYDNESPLDTHTIVLRDGQPVMLPTADALVKAESFTVERSVDDGDTWESVVESPGSHFQFSDFESLSNGVTAYRVTTYADTGAATVREFPMPADSQAVWLGGGVGFGGTCRLPFDPSLGLSPERERGMWKLAGNTRVAWAGEQAGTVVSASGRMIEGEDDTAQYDDMSRVFLDPEPLHLYRNPLGQRVHGVLSGADLQRTPGVGIWTYGFSLEEADRQEG